MIWPEQLFLFLEKAVLTGAFNDLLDCQLARLVDEKFDRRSRRKPCAFPFRNGKRRRETLASYN